LTFTYHGCPHILSPHLPTFDVGSIYKPNNLWGDMRKDILEILLVGSIGVGSLLFLLALLRLRGLFPALLDDKVLCFSWFITLISYLFLAAALLFHNALGGDYSSRRSVTIVVNCAAGVVSSLILFIRRKRIGWIPAISAVLLTLVWLIVGAASSAV